MTRFPERSIRREKTGPEVEVIPQFQDLFFSGNQPSSIPDLTR